MFLVVLALLSGYATISYARYRAQRLINAVRKLEAGKTTIEDAKILFKDFDVFEYDAHAVWYIEGEGGIKHVEPDPCLGEDPSFSFSVSPPRPYSWLVEKIPALNSLGWHWWSASVVVHQKDRKVSCYSQVVAFIRSDGEDLKGQADLQLRNPQSLVEMKPYEASSYVSRGRYHTTRVSVLTEASEAEKSRAFQMDLSCTVSRRGCFFPCQIMPLGWLDSLRDQQSHGFTLPEGANDTLCPAH